MDLCSSHFVLSFLANPNYEFLHYGSADAGFDQCAFVIPTIV